MTLTLTGTLTSKYAAHVPVFRNWKLVWERREFGTRRDHGSWTVDLPEAGGTVKVTGDWSLDVKLDGQDVEIQSRWNGIAVPGAKASFNLGRGKFPWLWSWRTALWKGVSLDVKAELAA